MPAFFSPPPASNYPTVGADTIDLRAIRAEVEKGLPNEQARIIDAQLNADYYGGEMEKHLDWHEAESAYEHAQRPRRLYPLTTRVVDVLCDHLYNPGPRRRLDAGASADEWLQEVYEDNHVDALMGDADVLSTLNDVAAIQVAAVGGPGAILDESGRDTGAYVPPAGIKIHLLGSEEFAVYTDPADPTRPWCVVTITRFDERTRYQVWTAATIETYWTKRGSGTSGGRVAELAIAESGTNPYGCLPFAFFHHRTPTRQFWTPGPGSGLRAANAALNTALSELALSIMVHGRPAMVAVNLAPGKLVLRPGGITTLPPAAGAIAEGREPRIDTLSTPIDISGMWADAENHLYTTLELHGVPRSAIRLEQSATASGVAIVAEQWPLITRARKRQRIAACAESALARVCLCVGGAYYGRNDLRTAAVDPGLQLAWPEIQINMPGPDKDAADDYEVGRGYKSKVQVVMERRGMTREQALAELKQIAEDNAELSAMGIDPGIPQPGIAPGDEPDGDEPADDENDDAGPDDDPAGDDESGA